MSGRNNSGGPSLKKKFVGLIKQISQSGAAGSGSQHTIPRPDTFIHKYLQGEVRGVQPTIVYGRTCEELPTRSLRPPRTRVVAAYTGPGGGLTSVNRKGHPPLQRDEPDLDYIDAGDAASDAQPNAYVTSQKPPPRKTLYGDVAAYFRKRDSPVAKKCVGGVGVGGGVSEGKSMDSLDCEPPSWRGEAPSPLSPHPARAPPSTAFLQFGEGPLNYGLSLPPAPEDSNSVGGSRSKNHSNSSSGSSAYPTVAGEGNRGDCMMEEVLISCRDETENGTTVTNQLISQPQQQPALDDNLNPLILVDVTNTKGTTPLDNANLTTTTPTTLDNAPNGGGDGVCENGNYSDGGESCGETSGDDDSGVTSDDGEGSSSEVSQRSKFLTLDLVEAAVMTAPDPDLRRSEGEDIAGLVNWNRPHSRAYGLSTTLYERHPITSERAGNPIADAFGVVAREDSALLALADGVNWGEKASVAARCAIHGCLHHLNTALFSPAAAPPDTTNDIFVALLRSFHAAHSLILQEDGMLTTLTAAVVVPLAGRDQFVVCVCNVGDSLAYVYSQKHGVREITQGSHDIYSMRDMRDALGALGPVDGTNPELNNLTCSLTYCDPGDVVFLTSDGISDNFDPVVGKFAIPRKEKEAKSASKEPPQAAPKPGTSQVNGVAEQEQKQQQQPQQQQQQPSNRNSGREAARGSSSSHGSRRNGQQQQQAGRTHRQHQHSQHSQQQRGRSRRSQQGTSSQQAPQTSRPTRQPVCNVKSVGAGLPEQGDGEETEGDPFLPLVEAHQRHELTLLRMEDLLRFGLTSPGPVTTAQSLCLEMVHFATKLTVAKRRILEDPDLYASSSSSAAKGTQQLSRNDQRNRRRKVCEKLALVPGKLDHATVVAYVVGVIPRHPDDPEEDDPVASLPRTAFRPAPLASPDSTRSLISQLDEARPPDLLPSAHDINQHHGPFNLGPVPVASTRKSDSSRVDSLRSSEIGSKSGSSTPKLASDITKQLPKIVTESKSGSSTPRAGSEGSKSGSSTPRVASDNTKSGSSTPVPSRIGEAGRGEKVGGEVVNISQDKENMSPNTGQVPCRPSLIETVV